MDYVHIITRLPELQLLVHEQDDIAHISHAQELDELTGTIPKVIEIVPKVLRNHADPRHKAAITEVISSLMQHLDALRPSVLVCPLSHQVLCTIFSDKTTASSATSADI
jgi:nuclear pore complex protein Nup98-Nup96